MAAEKICQMESDSESSIEGRGSFNGSEHSVSSPCYLEAQCEPIGCFLDLVAHLQDCPKQSRVCVKNSCIIVYLCVRVVRRFQ